MVEGALERCRRPGAPATAAASAAAPPTPGGTILVLLVAVAVFRIRGLLRGGLELRRDQRVVLGAQIDLVVEVQARAVGRLAALDKLVLALELLDLLDRHLELMGNPRVGAALADPAADLVEVGTQRAACHRRRGA